MSKTILGFFYDADGNKSYGRMASAYLVVAALLSFVAGLWLPTLSSYCATATTSFLTTAGAFYLTSKGQQAASNIFGKPTTAAAPTPEEPQQ